MANLRSRKSSEPKGLNQLIITRLKSNKEKILKNTAAMVGLGVIAGIGFSLWKSFHKERDEQTKVINKVKKVTRRGFRRVKKALKNRHSEELEAYMSIPIITSIVAGIGLLFLLNHQPAQATESLLLPVLDDEDLDEDLTLNSEIEEQAEDFLDEEALDVAIQEEGSWLANQIDITSDKLVEYKTKREAEFNKSVIPEQQLISPIHGITQDLYKDYRKVGTDNYVKPVMASYTTTLKKGNDLVLDQLEKLDQAIGRVPVSKDISEPLWSPTPTKIIDNTTMVSGNVSMAKPLVGDVRVSSGFGARVHPTQHIVKEHTGIDYAVPVGTEIVSPAEGIVDKVWFDDINGWAIRVQHGDGYMTHYAHLSHPLVQAGESINMGQVIALSGNTGRGTGAHLHYGVSKNGEYVNPLDVNFTPTSGVQNIVDSTEQLEEGIDEGTKQKVHRFNTKAVKKKKRELQEALDKLTSICDPDSFIGEKFLKVCENALRNKQLLEQKNIG